MTRRYQCLLPEQTGLWEPGTVAAHPTGGLAQDLLAPDGAPVSRGTTCAAPVARHPSAAEADDWASRTDTDPSTAGQLASHVRTRPVRRPLESAGQACRRACSSAIGWPQSTARVDPRSLAWCAGGGTPSRSDAPDVRRVVPIDACIIVCNHVWPASSRRTTRTGRAHLGLSLLRSGAPRGTSSVASHTTAPSIRADQRAHRTFTPVARVAVRARGACDP